MCVRVTGLYSTRGILKLDSRSQGKRRRTEEKAHSLPPESHILLNYEMGIYTDSCRLPWMNVGLFQVQIFSRVSLKKVAFSSLALSQAAFFLIQYSCKRKFSDQSIMLAAPAIQQQDCPRDYAAGMGSFSRIYCHKVHASPQHQFLARIALTHSQHVPYSLLSRSSKR